MGWVDDEQTPALYADKTPVRQLGSRSPSGVARAADFNAIKQALIDVREWLRDPANQGVSEAADVAFAPAGAISSTNVQAALEELDGIISFLGALVGGVDSALTAHTTDTSVHGTAGDVVGTTDTQTLSNKTHSGEFAVTDVAANSYAFTMPDGARLRFDPTGTRWIGQADGNVRIAANARVAALLVDTSGGIDSTTSGPLHIKGGDNNGATAVGVRISSKASYTTAGSKLVQIRNNTTETAFFNHLGALTIVGVPVQTPAVTIPTNSDIWLAPGGGALIRSDGSGTAAQIISTAGLSVFGGVTVISGHTARSAMNIAQASLVFQVATDATATPGAVTINKPMGRVVIPAGSSSVVVTCDLVATFGQKVHPTVTLRTLDTTLTSIRAVVVEATGFTIHGNAAATANCEVSFHLTGMNY